MKAYEIIVNQILEKLDNNILPWRQTRIGWSPCNYITNKEYRGLNKLILLYDDYKDKRYLTYTQIRNLKWRIKKWSKSQKVIYWQFVDTDNETLSYPIIKYYNVFNIAQVEWITLNTPKANIHIVEDKYNLANDLIKNYNWPKILEWSNPLYEIKTDTIRIPNKNMFNSLDNYYSVLFHELIHSTWHISRLDRFSNTKKLNFWNQEYSKEELVAEIGSMYLSMKVWISNKVTSNNIAYIQNWIKYLKNNTKELLYASIKAEKAYEYIILKE